MNWRLFPVPFTTLLLLAILCACSERAAGPEVFDEPPKIKRDATYDWIKDVSHFHDTTYHAVFDAYYAGLLAKNNYEGAAAALDAMTYQEMFYGEFRQQTLEQVRSFQQQASGKLPWEQLLFTNSYTGNYYLDRGEYRRAIACFRRITRFEPIDYNTSYEIGYAYSDMGFCYSGLGDQEKALENNLRALECFRRIGSPGSTTGGVYDNIALVHLFTKNYSEAVVYFDKALEAYGKDKDTNNMFTTLHNKILLYEETSSPEKYVLIDSAYSAFNASGIDNPSMKVSLSSFYVEKLLHEGKTAEARSLLKEIRKLVAQLDSPSSEADYYITLAQYEIKTGDGIASPEDMEKALEAVEEGEHFQNQLAFSEVLKKNAILKGDYQKALLYAEKENAAQNQLTNREMIAKTIELNKKHQTESKEQQIALQQEAIVNKNVAISLLLSVLLAFGLAVGIVSSRQKQRKIRLEVQRGILYTRQLLEKTEEERKRIAGDLHDSVSHELLNLKNTIPENNGETGAKIDAIINDIRIISRNLHPIMFEKVGLAASIEQLVERAQSIHNLMVTADIAYDAWLSTSDELQVYRIVQEALSNTIKYAQAVAAKITMEMRGDVLHIEVKDNGKGFDVAETLATSSAFGLHNILERSKAIGGFARIVSDRNGTVITLELKKHP